MAKQNGSNSSTPTKANVVPIKQPQGKKPHKKTIAKVLDGINTQAKVQKSGKAPKHLVLAWEPTPEQRDDVALLASAGVSAENIGKIIFQPYGIVSGTTIRRKFKKEYDVGSVQVYQSLVNKAYEKALKGDGTMIRYLLNARYGWCESGLGSSGQKDNEAETISKKMRTTAKLMADTLPKSKTGTD